MALSNLSIQKQTDSKVALIKAAQFPPLLACFVTLALASVGPTAACVAPSLVFVFGMATLACWFSSFYCWFSIF
jgi:hypothetical protein